MISRPRSSSRPSSRCRQADRGSCSRCFVKARSEADHAAHVVSLGKGDLRKVLSLLDLRSHIRKRPCNTVPTPASRFCTPRPTFRGVSLKEGNSGGGHVLRAAEVSRNAIGHLGEVLEYASDEDVAGSAGIAPMRTSRRRYL